MLEVITHQNMLRDINSNEIKEDTIGILITRPDSEVGKSILSSLNYFRYLSRDNTNFYLPGYGAYWYEGYPDGQVVTKIEGVGWSFSDKVLICFINDLETYSKWEYSGESGLFMLEYKDGILSYDNTMQLYLDNIMWDRVIASIPSFFQQLLRICKSDKSLKGISNVLGKDKLIQVTKENTLNNIPSSLANAPVQEKYSCIRSCGKRDVGNFKRNQTEHQFYEQIKRILSEVRNKVYRTANFVMAEAYWGIGKSIVEQQDGYKKVEYGSRLIAELLKQMIVDFGKGFTPTNSKYIGQFYLIFPDSHALHDELSWIRYRLLMRVENENAREFYTEEAIKSNWSARQLERQINSSLYEKLLSSQNKETVSREVQKLESVKVPENIIRDSYVLEFLGLSPNDDSYESNLEETLITHLQKFLLELGRGFSLAVRQKWVTFDGRHFRIDPVLYNYILKRFVLIDLKIGDLTHQDLGQMQMHIHYYECELMNEGDNPPIGIVLCVDKNGSVVKYTLPENEAQTSALEYKLYFLNEEELSQELQREYRALKYDKEKSE